jgi:hypothetical protein
MIDFVRLGSVIGPNRHNVMHSIVKFVVDSICFLPFLLSVLLVYLSCTRCKVANISRMRLVNRLGGFLSNVAMLGYSKPVLGSNLEPPVSVTLIPDKG